MRVRGKLISSARLITAHGRCSFIGIHPPSSNCSVQDPPSISVDVQNCTITAGILIGLDRMARKKQPKINNDVLTSWQQPCGFRPAVLPLLELAAFSQPPRFLESILLFPTQAVALPYPLPLLSKS